MKKRVLFALLVPGLLFGFGRSSETQTKPYKTQPEPGQNRPRVVAVNTNELESFPYDAGKVKFIATSEDTISARVRSDSS